MRSQRERWSVSAGWHATKDHKGNPHEVYNAAIHDDDFTYDGLLSVSGDFGGERKREYAEAIAAQLNAVPALRLLLQDVATCIAAMQNREPDVAPVTQNLLERIVEVYPVLHEYPSQFEPKQQAEQLEFNYRFNYTEAEIREREERAAALIGKRRHRGTPIEDLIKEIESTPEGKARLDAARKVVRYASQQQIPLNWDNNDDQQT